MRIVNPFNAFKHIKSTIWGYQFTLYFFLYFGFNFFLIPTAKLKYSLSQSLRENKLLFDFDGDCDTLESSEFPEFSIMCSITSSRAYF